MQIRLLRFLLSGVRARVYGRRVRGVLVLALANPAISFRLSCPENRPQDYVLPRSHSAKQGLGYLVPRRCYEWILRLGITAKEGHLTNEFDTVA